MLDEFTVRFWQVLEESVGRDETPRQTCHEQFFEKNLAHLLYYKTLYSKNQQNPLLHVMRNSRWKKKKKPELISQESK